MRFLAIVLFVLLCSARVRAADWRPVGGEDLALKVSKMDPGADAEALFREVRVLNEAATFGYPHNLITEYIRLKIFTDRGKEKYGTVQLPFGGKSIISNVEGRTIHADGTIVELKKDAIFDKVVERNSGAKTKVISFAMPAVEAGSIIEYRWTLNVGEFISRYVPLDVQSDFPVDEVTFHIKPVTGVMRSWPMMRYLPFGCTPSKPVAEPEGFSMMSVRNVPAFRAEPMMPPHFSARQWILIYYEENANTTADKFWAALGRQIYGGYSPQVKVNEEVKQTAREITAGAASDEEKVDRIAEYCRRNLKDIEGEEISTEAREQAKKANSTSVDTLRRKQGTTHDIDIAFLALASGAGFNARLARISDRATFLFNPVYLSQYFLDSSECAVFVNNQWKFYNITNTNLPPGVLRWPEQGVYALITGPKDPAFVQTPLLSSGDTTLQRIGDFKLSADGVLEGNVREIRSGNHAIEWRERYGRANQAEREEALRNAIKHRFADFDLSDIHFTVSPDVKMPVGATYRIVVRNYAQRTGKRLFIQPGFFEVGQQSRFTDAARTQGVYFDYPWTENDAITLQLPEGYQLDHADAPAGVRMAPVGSYGVRIQVTKTNQIIYHRTLIFGTGTLLAFDVKAYPAIKQFFDKVHESDNHLLTVKTEVQPAPGQ